jgi:hypothetical protein
MQSAFFSDRLTRRTALLSAAAVSLSAFARPALAEGNEGLISKLRSFVGDAAELPADMREEFAYLMGMEAYAYGFPLVMMEVTRQVTVAAANSGGYSAPLNQLGRMRTYVSPDFKNVVRISRNSLWSFRFVDLNDGPFVFSQPDTKGRYIVTQALNMWTDDFASIGSRTTGTGAGNFLIARAGWSGALPSDVKNVYQCSTRYAWVLTQMAAASPAEFPAINALQDQLKLTPLGAWGGSYTPPSDVPVDPAIDLTATPYDQLRLMTGEEFFRRFSALLKDNPPYAADSAIC